MKGSRIVLALLALLAMATAGVGRALAGLEEIEDGVYVDDFEDGMLLDWDLSRGTDAEIDEGEENSVLNVRGAGQLVLLDMQFRNFLAEVTLKGGGGGLFFGGKYQALITTSWGGSLTVREAGKELAMLKRGYRIGRSYRLKVVCFGPLIRVYVNGQQEFEKTDARPIKGPLALVTGEKGALLDDVKISTKLSPEEGAMAVPVEEDQALVFSSETDANVHLKTANATSRGLRLIAAIRPPKSTYIGESGLGADTKGRIVKYGTKYFYAIESVPGKPVARAETVLKPGSEEALDLNLGKIPPGSYLLDLSFAWGGQEHSHRLCLFIVFRDIEPVKYRAPVIPVGTYTAKLPKAMRAEDPLWWYTYVHAMGLTLKQYHLSAAVACGAFETETVEILQQYGVAGVQRGTTYLDHPGIIATLLGDEPSAAELDYYRAQYEEAQKKTVKPVTTCCVGEGIGLGGKHFFWQATQPRVRAFRWYGFKKHFYGIHHHLVYKGVLPISDVLRISYASFDTPYWLLPLSNGGTEHEAYFQFPSAAQHRGILHLAMAYGARGSLFYSLQEAFGAGLVDTVTLKPNGRNLAAIGEVAGCIQRHAELLCSLEVGKFDVRCESPDIEPVPLHDGKDGRYVYVINRNTRARVSCKVFWPVKLGRAKVKDIYADAAVQTERDGSFVAVTLDLAPGDGRLLEVSRGE